MTAPQIVVTAAAVAVVVAVGLMVAGVAVLAGLGWALLTAGALIAVCAVGGAAVLLADGGPTG